MPATIVFITLLLLLFLFAWGRIRHDFVAMIGLFILVVAGIIEPANAFTGFAHPAVITVAAVLIIGKALERSGLIEVIGKRVMKLGKNITLQIFTLCVLVAIASAFMNNVGALAIMMPIAIHLARKNGNPPSLLLMPIAFASLLGGMTTLIGTPPNIIIATFRSDEFGEPFGMFDFTPVGAVLTFAGLIFISLLGWRLLPKRTSAGTAEATFNLDDYITEAEVPENSKANGASIEELNTMTEADFQVLGIVRNNIRIHIPRSEERLQKGDILILETDASELTDFVKDTGVR
ncbi:MAG: SLC13 family permease, partial [Bacteroidales bacterium]